MKNPSPSPSTSLSLSSSSPTFGVQEVNAKPGNRKEWDVQSVNLNNTTVWQKETMREDELRHHSAIVLTNRWIRCKHSMHSTLYTLSGIIVIVIVIV